MRFTLIGFSTELTISELKYMLFQAIGRFCAYDLYEKHYITRLNIE